MVEPTFSFRGSYVSIPSMGKSQRLGAWGALAFGIGMIVIFAMPSYRQGEASLSGSVAKDFPLELSGKPLHLSDLRGKIVVLDFWASWCPPCVQEAPSLNRLQKYIESRNALVLGVAADEDPYAFSKFIVDQGVTFPTYRDPATKERGSPIALSYGTSVIPEAYIIDRHGKIARKVIGPQEWDSADMRAYFDALLAQN
ncbi:MAG: resA [Candidatus Acidoferrum typicum]|nr:resA [Candidatus Acidoferrum typicum]